MTGAQLPPIAADARHAAELLDREGIALLPDLLPLERLERIATAFRAALSAPTFNTWRGYEQTEKWRLVVEDVLALDPAVLDVALHPTVLGAVRAHVGPGFALVEARGWRTIKARTDFHGWHSDAWYGDVGERPREVKLGLYLSQVDSGHFAYAGGSHRLRDRARHWSPREAASMARQAFEVKGPAGTAFLFDTAGVHRQAAPVLRARDVIFLNFHDPSVPLQDLDVAWGRYRPLTLNAGMLPDLTEEERRVLGWGRARGQAPGEAVQGRAAMRRFPILHAAVSGAIRARLEIAEIERHGRRLRRGLRKLSGMVGTTPD